MALLGWCFWPNNSFLEVWENINRHGFLHLQGHHATLYISLYKGLSFVSSLLHSPEVEEHVVLSFTVSFFLLAGFCHDTVLWRTRWVCLLSRCPYHCAVELLNLIGAKHSLASCSHQWNCMSCCCKYLGSWCLKNAWVFHGFVESCRSSVQHSAQARTERVIVSHNTEITVFWAWHQPWNAHFSRALLST